MHWHSGGILVDICSSHLGNNNNIYDYDDDDDDYISKPGLIHFVN